MTDVYEAVPLKRRKKKKITFLFLVGPQFWHLSESLKKNIFSGRKVHKLLLNWHFIIRDIRKIMIVVYVI